MNKSKKQFAAKHEQGPSQEFARTVELAFFDHPWPASRADVLEHASRERTFAKSDIARLKQIPQREYHSIEDLMEAVRQTSASPAQGPGPVATAERNRRAMGEVSSNPMDAPMRPAKHHQEKEFEQSM